MLRGMKRYTSDITAVVSVADDGGGSGVLREDCKNSASGRYKRTADLPFPRWSP